MRATLMCSAFSGRRYSMSNGKRSSFMNGLSGGCGCLTSIIGFIVSLIAAVAIVNWYQTGQNPIDWITSLSNPPANNAALRAKFVQDVRGAYAPLERSYTHLFIKTLNPYYMQQEADREQVRQAYAEFKENVVRAKASRDSFGKPPDKDCEALASTFASYVEVLEKGADGFSGLAQRIAAEKFDK